MNLQIFPPIVLSKTELEVVATQLDHPTVRKYLMKVAYDNAQNVILGQASEGESAESYLRRQAAVQGRLEALEMLLNIKAASPAISS